MTPISTDRTPFYTAMTPSDLVLAVDIGGTKTAAALATRDGALLDERATSTPGSQGREAILRTVAELVSELLAVAAGRGQSVLALGVGSAGVIDAVAGTVLSATDVLAGWAGTNLRAELMSRTGLDQVAVDNDVHAHAIGEAWTGTAAGAGSVFFVGVGTGIGASILIDGRVWHGGRHVAGHFGHLPVPAAAGLPCVCGAAGHLEAVGAGPAIVADYNRTAGTTLDSLVDVAALDDPRAAAAIVSGAAAVGGAIGGAVNLLDPERVIVGGGLVGIGPRWWDPLEGALRAELLPPLRDIVVAPARLGSSAALVGAARLAWEAL